MEHGVLMVTLVHLSMKMLMTTVKKLTVLTHQLVLQNQAMMITLTMLVKWLRPQHQQQTMILMRTLQQAYQMQAA